MESRMDRIWSLDLTRAAWRKEARTASSESEYQTAWRMIQAFNLWIAKEMARQALSEQGVYIDLPA